MNERKGSKDRKEWGYESKEMQLNIVNLDRMQKTKRDARTGISVEITKIYVYVLGYNFNYE